jgi:hypothetical protein
MSGVDDVVNWINWMGNFMLLSSARRSTWKCRGVFGIIDDDVPSKPQLSTVDDR